MFSIKTIDKTIINKTKKFSCWCRPVRMAFTGLGKEWRQAVRLRKQHGNAGGASGGYLGRAEGIFKGAQGFAQHAIQ